MDHSIKGITELSMAEYAMLSAKTDKHTQIIGSGVLYYATGLVDEVGELFGKVKKLYRDRAGVISDDVRADVKKELGDILWYATQLASAYDVKVDIDQGVVTVRNLKVKSQVIGEGTARLFMCLNLLALSSSGINAAVMSSELFDWGDGYSIQLSIENIFPEIIETARVFGLTFDEIAIANIEKLFDRKQRGKISGSGDNR